MESITSDFLTSNVGECEIAYQDNIIQYAIPLSLIGKTSDKCEIRLKVTDNIQEQKDIQDYYVSGDAAPIGRLGYTYGY